MLRPLQPGFPSPPAYASQATLLVSAASKVSSVVALERSSTLSLPLLMSRLWSWCVSAADSAISSPPA
eukprot:1950588-Pleurochrysis_carterae.AAC.1